MIDPSGIEPKNDKLIVKELKLGLYIIENAFEGIHEDFVTSNFDVRESSIFIEKHDDSRERSPEDWREAFGTKERTTITTIQLNTDTNTDTDIEEDTTTKFKNQ